MRLIKIGARIAETASRVRIALAAAHPEAALFASLAHCCTLPDHGAGAKRPIRDEKTHRGTAFDAQMAATATKR